MADGQMDTPMPENAVDSAVTSPDTAEAPGETASSEIVETPAEDKAPKWDGEFDPDRAAKLVANLRSEKDELKRELAELKKALSEREEVGKSELAQLRERAEKAEKELAQLKTQSFIASALREHGLSEDLSEFVSGGSEEEIKAKVAKLAEKLGPTPVVTGKPKPKLVPGEGSEAAAPDFDPEAIAAKIRKRL